MAYWYSSSVICLEQRFMVSSCCDANAIAAATNGLDYVSLRIIVDKKCASEPVVLHHVAVSFMYAAISLNLVLSKTGHLGSGIPCLWVLGKSLS